MAKHPNPPPPEGVRPEPPPGPPTGAPAPPPPLPRVNWQIQAHEYSDDWGTGEISYTIGTCSRCGYPKHDSIHAVSPNIAKLKPLYRGYQPAKDGDAETPPRGESSVKPRRRIGTYADGTPAWGYDDETPVAPAYPRCATCKHFQSESSEEAAERAALHPSNKDEPPIGWCSQIGGGSEGAEIVCGCHGNLKVAADFGCVLHSEIAG